MELIILVLAITSSADSSISITASGVSSVISSNIQNDYDLSKDVLIQGCPTGCNCSGLGPTTMSKEEQVAFTKLDIRCSRDLWIEASYQELGKLLSQFDNLTSLLIEGADLRNYTIICNLSSLATLILNDNQIKTLYPQCFSKMKYLSMFQVESNRIQRLPDGLFHGLEHLTELLLGHNQINSIGTSVFSDISTFPHLSMIDLSWNDLFDLDPWPIARFASCPGSTVNVENNRIAKLTNKMNWDRDIFDPTQPINNGTLKVSNNQITHLHWFLQTWKTYNGTFKYPSGTQIVIEAFNNPLKCDCMVSLKSFVTEILFDYEQYYCLTPDSLRGTSLYVVNRFLSYEDDVKYGVNCNITADCPVGCTCLLYGRKGCKMDISCKNAGLLNDIPETLPDLPVPIVDPFATECIGAWVYTYNIDFSHNRLSSINEKDYLFNTTYLDLSHNAVSSISNDTFQIWKILGDHILNINLTGNNFKTPMDGLKELEQEIGDYFIIDLRDNPWVCDCHAKWFKHWIFQVSQQVQYPFIYEDIKCASPKKLHGLPIYHLSDADFVCGGNDNIVLYMVVPISSIFGLLCLVGIPIIVLYCYRFTVFTRFKWRIFDRDECKGEDMMYDVFISYANEDEEIVLEVYHWLQNEEGYKCCIHKHDFLPGSSIMENVGVAIEGSKRTLCFLSPHFLESQMCLWEFEMAMNFDVQNRKHRLITVLIEDFDRENMPNILQFYLSKFTYIEHDRNMWREKILFNLPGNKLGLNTNSFEGEASSTNPETEDQPLIDNSE